ncbi:0eceb1fb-63d3-4e52-8431-52711d048127-CDS [Sclerotinia trifoliorum]|uniref:0eceb1fb-63d3-4e52-8431-52711d048127-CDS n=1 Tax=Sclerotinia trifoliorum TaxID=28548 RepID=A0A8H2VYG2_9HELO|nr:0eceb1fb-63d3-4e52-8431-52711d048127-CDS [Sclerotinia trifoliorum]
MADRTIWVPSEIAFFNEVVNSFEDNTLESKWATIARGMISEQPKHLRGGVLFVQDPWPERLYTPQRVFLQWRTMQENEPNSACIRESALPEALEETKVAVQELERTLMSLEEAGVSIFSWQFVEGIEQELERLREIGEEFERLNELTVAKDAEEQAAKTKTEEDMQFERNLQTLERNLQRLEALGNLGELEFPLFSEGFVQAVEEELERLKELRKAKSRR